jgi:hypothetical protein
MASPQDELSTACNRQMELAGQCFESGMAAAQRMLVVQMEGVRQLFELYGQSFAAPEAEEAEEAGALPWVNFCRRTVAGGAQAFLVYFRICSAQQMEAVKLAEEVFPDLKQSIERSTLSVLAASSAGHFETPHRRAA